MNILFIKPGIGNYKSSGVLEPLAFAVLKALTPAEIHITFIDNRIEPIDYSLKPDLVALSVETFAASNAYSIADRFRKQGIKVVMGGFHVSALPEEALLHADAVVVGDAEYVWQKLLNDFRNDEMQPLYSSVPASETLITSYDRSIFKNKKYLPLSLIQWGRGCAHNCDFCSVSSFYNSKQYIRPVSDVIKEMKDIKSKIVFIVDDNIYKNEILFDEFLEAATPLKKKWACQISLDVAKKEGIIQKMAQAGCFAVVLGFESLNVDNLAQMNKSWNRSKTDFEKTISIFRQNNIMIYGSFIFGYDHDTNSAFTEAIEFAIKNKFFIANFNQLYTLPGTPLYQYLYNTGKLIYHKWWINPDFQYGKTMFHPANISAAELEKECFNARLKFNSLSSIFRRSSDIKANAHSFRNFFIYWMANLTNRKEIRKKQGKSLGQQL